MISTNKIILNCSDFLAAIQDYMIHNGAGLIPVGASIEFNLPPMVGTVISVKDLASNPRRPIIYIEKTVDDNKINRSPTTYNTYFDVFDNNVNK
jgi:hypothetical protein